MHKIIVLVTSMLILTACGQTISIPSGTVGRQLSTDGLETKIYQPGAMRLDACPFTACPQMVVLQTGLSAEEISVGTVFLPQSNVDLSDVKLAVQFRVRPNEQSINRIYHDVTSDKGENERIRHISADMLYRIYLQRLVPNIIIAVLRDYSVEQVLSNVDKIAIATHKKIGEEMKDQPIEVTEVGFPNGIGKPPEQVLDAKRNLYVVNENITRQVRELEGQLRVEQQRQIVQQLRVKNDVTNAETAGLPVGQYMELKIMERFADERVPLGFVPSMVAK
jgi:hypothetical protein